MPLTHCIECNREISDSAFTCPGCSTMEPFGVECELCGERLRRSAGVTSIRREIEVEWVREDGPGHWFHRDPVDRHIVAHQECLERYYTPPATLECSDCGLRLASSDLGFTALSLWSGTSHGFRCPRCGGFRLLGSLLDRVQCEWALGSPFQRAFGTYPCMKPLYSFQVGPNGQGHRHAKQERAEAERKRAEADPRQRRRKDEADEALRNAASKKYAGSYAVGGAYLGAIAMGLAGFVSCAYNIFTSNNTGFNLITGALIGAIGGALIGAIIGALFGQTKS